MSYRGLTDEEVNQSRLEHGSNVLTPAEREPWWRLFLEKFEDPVIRILLVAVVISFITGAMHGEYLDSLGIAVAVLLATGLAFANEFKAAKEFDLLLTSQDETPVKVFRHDVITSVPKKDIVVGDVVILETGEEIPADGHVLEALGLRVDESKLTGESVPVKKDVPGSSSDGGKAYPVDFLLRGCAIREGDGVMKVSAVGDGTEIGRTAKAAAEETGEDTPLNKQLEGLSKLIGVVGFGVAAGLFTALVWRGVSSGGLVLDEGQWKLFWVGIVALLAVLSKVWVPIFYDGLELAGVEKEVPSFIGSSGAKSWIVTVGIGAGILLIGAMMLALTGSIAKSPSLWMPSTVLRSLVDYFMIAVTIIVVAVPEGLAMSVTLSLAYSMRAMMKDNNLVRRMHACETIGAASVICSDKTGTLTKNEMKVVETSFDLDQAMALSIAMNSSATIGEDSSGKPACLGNPTECALLMAIEEQGFDAQEIRDQNKIQARLPFSTERKLMATVVDDILHVKGAPEIVLGLCDKDPSAIIEEITALQARGMRALGFATRRLDDGESPERAIEDLRDMTWVGFAAIMDPVRDEVPDAVRGALSAGIDVKIVTGDVKATAIEIGRQCGLVLEGDDPEVISMDGSTFSQLSDEEAREAVKRVKIIWRARPLDKRKLVKTLQDNGQVVAVTGDGTNDAPALNFANVGLAMGMSGTDVAKEAADIVLLDDSFASIVRAVKWGRSLYANIQRFILFQLTINLAALTVAFLGPFIGVALPFTVIQMLWINLIMDTLAALALASEPPHDDVMAAKPRDPEAFILSPAMIKNISCTGGAFALIMVTWLIFMERGGITDRELTIFFSSFVILQFWNMFNARVFGRTVNALSGITENKAFLLIALGIGVFQILVVQYGGAFFRTVPLGVMDWIFIFIGTSPVLIVGELLRQASRKKITN